MPLLPYRDHVPRVGEGVWLAEDAYVVGDVQIDGPGRLEGSAVLRGDQSGIRVGSRFRLGRRSTVHVELDRQTLIGDGVWVGDEAVVHATTLGDSVRVEDGARVLSRSTIGAGSVVAAGSLVPEGAEFPPNSYLAGTPARRQRETTAEERAETERLTSANSR